MNLFEIFGKLFFFIMAFVSGKEAYNAFVKKQCVDFGRYGKGLVKGNKAQRAGVWWALFFLLFFTMGILLR